MHRPKHHLMCQKNRQQVCDERMHNGWAYMQQYRKSYRVTERKFRKSKTVNFWQVMVWCDTSKITRCTYEYALE